MAVRRFDDRGLDTKVREILVSLEFGNARIKELMLKSCKKNGLDSNNREGLGTCVNLEQKKKAIS